MNPYKRHSREWYLYECSPINPSGLHFFEKVVLKEAWDERFHDFGQIQEDMCNFYQDPRWSRKFLSAFRGSYKTTTLEGYFTWNFSWHSEAQKADSIIYNTWTKENAFLFQGNVKHNLLENEMLQWIFQSLPKQEKDYKVMTKNRIQIRQTYMDFASVETSLVSRHYPKWVNDDMENDRNIRYETGREDLKDKWRYQQAILTKIRKKGIGMQWDIGTPFHYQGLIWMIKKNPLYKKLLIPCWNEVNGKKVVTFPELYSVEDFEEKRENMSSSIFAAQYELKPIAEEDALVRNIWLRQWKQLPSRVWRTLVIDPGGAEPGKSDPTGVTVCDTDEFGNLYVVHAANYWISPNELIDLISTLRNDYHPDDMRIEKERFSITIADMFKHRFPLMNISFVEHGGRKKEGRIWKMRQWYEKRKVFHAPNGMEDLEDQLLQYQGEGSIKYDDLIDSLSYHFDIRRIPSAYVAPRLPSGKVWIPSVEESFEKEINQLMEDNDEEARLNDAIY